MITRRGFLTALAGLVAAPALLKAAPKLLGVDLASRPDATVVTLRRGDVFTIEGVYAWNPATRRPTDRLQRFVITADVTGSTVTVEAIHPPMLFSGHYMNVHGRNPVDPAWHTVPMRLIRPDSPYQEMADEIDRRAAEYAYKRVYGVAF